MGVSIPKWYTRKVNAIGARDLLPRIRDQDLSLAASVGELRCDRSIAHSNDREISVPGTAASRRIVKLRTWLRKALSSKLMLT